jgi:Mn2+/Fe2+ NRAMP family transporter
VASQEKKRRKAAQAARKPNQAHRGLSVSPSRPLLNILGPGLITGASDDDPSGIATYSQAGAQFGYGMAWTMIVTYPLMAAVQEISARIGRTTGQGLAGNISRLYPAPIVYGLVALLLIANVINIGANLGAMGEAIGLVIGGPHLMYVAAFGLVCAAMQVFLKYTRYVSVLKSDARPVRLCGDALRGQYRLALAECRPFTPADVGSDYWQMTVAILGTTISPYLFFWQASQEVEDIRDKPRRQPLLRKPQQARGAYERIRLDTLLGMGLSNAVALAIMVTVAATLHQAGVTQIDSAAQAAEALRPIGGELAFLLFALGIIGTGLLSVPVLAGSAAYAIGEAAHWKVGLSRKPAEARGFYGSITAATLIGMALNVLEVSPIRALYWSAVINGVVAVPVIAAMMLMTDDPRVMGEFTISGKLRLLGWATALAMGLAVLAMAATRLI